MTTLTAGYKRYFTDRRFLASSFVAFLMLFASLVINFYAGIYATEKASGAVTDIILSNTRVFDVDGIFIYGPVALSVLLAFMLLHKPHRIPFMLKSIGLFITIRAIFISLTHIGPFPTHIMIPPSNFITDFTPGGDLFFSGHVGLPFLLALIFWDEPFLRILFIACSLVFGAIVLMAHLHYSIDVLSAFFITYSIYRLAQIFFKKDGRLFAAGLED